MFYSLTKNHTIQHTHKVNRIQIHFEALIYSILGEVVQTMKLTLMMKRHTSEHVLHTLVPSLMLCVASSMSLFIPYDLYAARMSLSGTTCLSMITLFTGAK